MEGDRHITAKIIDLLDNGRKFSQFKDRLIIYKDEQIPLGIAVNCEGFKHPVLEQPEGIDVFLALKSKYSDHIRIFVKVGVKVYMPNAKSNLWIQAKTPKQLWTKITNTGMTFAQMKFEFKEEQNNGGKRT